MATTPPLFTAVTSSTRQLLPLLKSISFAKKAQIRITAEGMRFSTEEGSVMEAFIFLEKALFTSYTYNAPPPPSSQEDAPPPPVFEISLSSLLETLNIFTLSDPNATKRPGDQYESFAAHRLNRHAGINAFSNHALGMSGVCRFSYEGEGSPLRIHMSESGVTTTCDLTTYEADSAEEIPFNRDNIALKTIMRSAYLLDVINELSSMNPALITIVASPTSRSGANLSITASGSLGSAAVDFSTDAASVAGADRPEAFDTPILETFHCPAKTTASFKFTHIKAAQRAMATAAKVSMRLDEAGVLSLQFLVEVEGGADKGEGVAFVDFRIVPLVESEGDVNGADSDETDEE